MTKIIHSHFNLRNSSNCRSLVTPLVSLSLKRDMKMHTKGHYQKTKQKTTKTNRKARFRVYLAGRSTSKYVFARCACWPSSILFCSQIGQCDTQSKEMASENYSVFMVNRIRKYVDFGLNCNKFVSAAKQGMNNVLQILVNWKVDRCYVSV